MREEFEWAQKYRPKTVVETILPERLKAPFKTFVKNKDIPNMILTGGAGVGKTTIAEAMCREIGCNWIKINGSDENGIDMLRTKVKDYASTVSMVGGRKVIIIDEADYLTPNVQAGLRAFFEEYSHNVSFILTCNFRARLIDALHSRAPIIDFRLTPAEKMEMAGAFSARIQEILKAENITYDVKVINKVIIRHFPDYRRVLGELQRYAAQTNNNIDVGILAAPMEDNVKTLLKYMKEKDFSEVRKWAAHNAGDVSNVFKELYKQLEDQCGDTYPHAILLIADYQYKSAFVADQEINLTALCAELMLNCTFK